MWLDQDSHDCSLNNSISLGFTTSGKSDTAPITIFEIFRAVFSSLLEIHLFSQSSGLSPFTILHIGSLLLLPESLLQLTSSPD